MIINSLKILFVISASRINKQGLAPLICRITYNKKRKEFSTGLFIHPKKWNNKQQIAKPPNEENNILVALYYFRDSSFTKRINLKLKNQPFKNIQA